MKLKGHMPLKLKKLFTTPDEIINNTRVGVENLFSPFRRKSVPDEKTSAPPPPIQPKNLNLPLMKKLWTRLCYQNNI